jgi:hypothetical protein
MHRSFPLRFALPALVLAVGALAPTARAADQYDIDPIHSVILFRIGTTSTPSTP